MRPLETPDRQIFVYDNAESEDLPLTGQPYLPPVSTTEGFTPKHSERPTLYPGDALVLVQDEEIVAAELIIQKLDDSVMVQPLDGVLPRLVDDGYFGSRFYRVDETHIYDNIAPDLEESNVEYDPTKLGTFEIAGRQR